MRTLLLAALLVAGPALARAPFPAVSSLVLAQASSAPSSTSTSKDEDDEDEDKPKAPPATPAEPAAPPAGAVTTPTPPAAADAKSQQLVSGAPLYNPNVAVHIVEKKQFADRGKHEIVLYPAWVQLNGKFTQHVGTALSYVYHLQENFGIQLTPLYNWVATESGFNRELVDKVRVEAQAATSLLFKWGAVAGVEATPLYGKFAFYEGNLAHFAFVVNAGAGIGSTLHQLKPETDTADNAAATYGDTGFKFTGSIGLGGRVQLGDRFAIRLEVRDLVYTARVDTINGCSTDDMTRLRAALQAQPGRTNFDSVMLGEGSTCAKDKFNNHAGDIPLALRIVSEPSSDVLNNVGFYAGFSVLF